MHRLSAWFPCVLFLGCGSPHAQISRSPDPERPPPVATSTPVPTSEARPLPTASTPKTPPPEWWTGGGVRSVASPHGMVSSVEPHATRAGVQMLEAGGNAVDAAVAVAFALAVTHPVAGNVGGGGFMLIGAAGQATVAIDFRERAPAATTDAAFAKMLAAGARGPLAVGVPGSVAGLLLAHERIGRLPREVVLQPAIDLAQQGHALGERQALTLEWAWPDLRKDAEARRIFGRPDGTPKRAGEPLLQADLGSTLQRIAREGAAGFYAGTTAGAIATTIGDRGGLVSLADLTGYRAVLREPLVTEYRGLRVEVMGPPSAGGVAVVEMLAMLERLEAWQWDRQSLEAAHVFAEVAKRAHADRRFGVVDPDSVRQSDPVSDLAHWRQGASWLERFPIGDRATSASLLHQAYRTLEEEPENTTHFSVADRDGQVVSCTTTLSRGYGARFVVPGTGVLLNNSFAAFGTAGLDVPQAGRRMTSSMSPTLVWFAREPVLVLGSPGGDTIPNTVVQVLRNLVDYRLPLDAAVDAPRVHHGFVPDQVLYESTRPPEAQVLIGLKRRGHVVSGARRTIGDANVIAIWDGTFFGYADPREGGLALSPTSVVEP